MILSARLWREQFSAEPKVLGQTLTLDGRPHVVVGVARPDFFFPDRDLLLWTPYVISPQEPDSVDVFFALARLAPGATRAQAEAEGTAAARSATRPFVADLFFGKGGPVEVQVRPILEEMTSRVRPALLVLVVGVGLVLLVACANVAALTLSRGLERERELAVRTALGAGRGRLARQLLTESLLVALLGGAVGFGLAWGAIRVLPALAPEGFPRIENVRIDVGVMAFALTVSVFAGLLAGVLPALRGARTGLSPVLHDGGSRATGRRAGRIGQGLLVAEAALAVVLLVGAALLVRSFAELVKVDAGYDPTGVLMAQVCFPESTPAVRRRQSIDDLLSRLKGTPGVIAAATGNMPPFAHAVSIAGAPLPWRGADGEPVTARVLFHAVSPGYAEALRLRLREGRWLEASDAGRPVRAMLVNQEFVRAYVRDGRSVVGRRLLGFMSDEKTTTEIVGVVGDVLKDGLDAKAQPEVYVADASEVPAEVSLVVRTEGDPRAVAPLLTGLVGQIDPTAATDGIATLSERVSSSVAEPRFAALVLTTFAVLALGLAATGLYGVLSYNVSERRREIGIRGALGARRADLLALVLRQGLTLTLGGLALGLLAAVFAARLLAGLLFGITPGDAAAFATAPVLLLPVALAACLIPARRAASVDPAVALRSE